MVVETVATEVSARITVKEKLAPGVKAEFGSDANTLKPPPSATPKLTAPFAAFNSGLSRLTEAPSTQCAVAVSVSHTPPVRRSVGQGTVLAPLPPPEVTRKIPS